MPKVDYRLNALVDADNLDPTRLAELARVAAENGATLIQYRDKASPTRAMVERARAIHAALAGTGVPLVVNDRIDVALAAGVEGVHLGREDMVCEDARRLLGPDAIIGLTVKNDADADVAAQSSADYACIGGVFATISKTNPDAPVGLAGLSALSARIRAVRPDLPIGAIAGIDLQTAPQAISAGADGVAVISAIFRAADPAQATRELRNAVDLALKERGA
ncbi:thiamine phosphate synthase [Corticibacterium sp. UT-5YL-CI-8]|nr:thiamine phosphate synthase [Tianweitania sp. UT-5YL-CI-8]